MNDQIRDERLRGERLQIMLTADELAALDDWRFARRMPSRAAAVRELLRRGLTAEGVSLADSRRKSKDFSVTDGAPSDRRDDGERGDGAARHTNGHRFDGDGADV